MEWHQGTLDDVLQARGEVLAVLRRRLPGVPEGQLEEALWYLGVADALDELLRRRHQTD